MSDDRYSQFLAAYMAGTPQMAWHPLFPHALNGAGEIEGSQLSAYNTAIDTAVFAGADVPASDPDTGIAVLPRCFANRIALRMFGTDAENEVFNLTLFGLRFSRVFQQFTRQIIWTGTATLGATRLDTVATVPGLTAGTSCFWVDTFTKAVTNGDRSYQHAPAFVVPSTPDDSPALLVIDTMGAPMVVAAVSRNGQTAAGMGGEFFEF